DNGERGTICVGAAVLRTLARDGLVSCEGARLALTEEGVAAARRAAGGADAYLAQHVDIGRRVVETPAGRFEVASNIGESPLSKLAHRRNRNGEAFLSRAEFQAGERLRSDFTRGRLMPRMGANWQAAVSSGRRDGGAGGI